MFLLTSDAATAPPPIATPKPAPKLPERWPYSACCLCSQTAWIVSYVRRGRKRSPWWKFRIARCAQPSTFRFSSENLPTETHVFLLWVGRGYRVITLTNPHFASKSPKILKRRPCAKVLEASSVNSCITYLKNFCDQLHTFHRGLVFSLPVPNPRLVPSSRWPEIIERPVTIRNFSRFA